MMTLTYGSVCIQIAADGPRYKALGNSMACNVMAWIGRRIALYEAAIGRNFQTKSRETA